MIQVKIIKSLYNEDLEDEINDFLKGHEGLIEIKDIKAYTSGTDNCCYCCMIIYKTDDNEVLYD